MDLFLGREEFPGPALGAGEVIDRFMGEARFDGCLASTNWPRAAIERTLPSELTLATNRSPAPELHPVLFMFGDLRKTTILCGDTAIPTGVEYPEFLMAIPFVRHRRGRYLHTYMARMYSSVCTAVLVGNTHYGFAKVLATMRRQGALFMVTSTDGAHLLAHAAVEADPQANGRRGDAVTNLASLRAALSLPILGRRADGSMVSSYFDLDFSAAAVQPADAWISIDAPIVDGLPPRRCYDSPGGTILFNDAIWRLSWPLRCRF